MTNESSSEAVPQITEITVNQIKEDLKITKDGLIEAQDNLRHIQDSTRKDIDRVNNWLLFAVLFFSVTFIVAMVSLFWSGILSSKSDKELYLKYNDVFKNYSDKNTEMNDKVYKLEIEINGLTNKLDILKAKNTYLK